MAKLVFSLFVVSLLSFLGVSEYTLPDFIVPITAVDFFFEYNAMIPGFENYSSKVTYVQPKFSFLKVGNHLSIEAQTTGTPIDYTDFPFGVHIYRNDVKAHYSYAYASTAASTEGVHYQCVKEPETTLDAAMNKYIDYIDLAHSVRGKPVCKSAGPNPYYAGVWTFTYDEERDITDEKYDKVKISHVFYVDNETAFCLVRTKSYYRRQKGSENYEASPFATESLNSGLSRPVLITSEDVLQMNNAIVALEKFFMNVAEYYFAPNVAYTGSGRSLVCPEIDHLPAPRITEFLPGNYTEYQFILENPASVKQLVEDVSDILNLTKTHSERVSFSQVEKLDKEWAVDIIVPTELGEILKVAVENRDVRKSGYEIVSQVKKMVAKK